MIRHLHKCESKHLETVPVKEIFRGQTVWEGDVEVFAIDHPKAKKCYAWSYHEGQPDERFTAVLEIPPVESPITAVRVSIVADAKQRAK